MTRESGRLLAVVSADCAPILLLDPDSGWIAAVHAGWRGTSLRILDPVLETLLQRGAALSRLLVLIGPCISRDRYEVGPDVVEALDEAYASFDLDGAKRPAPDGRAFVDVAGYNRALLRRRGVPADRILCSDLCTASRPDLFPSYRRDGPGAGRIITGLLRR